MNILIVGCGDVGSELAKILSTEDHNVTIVDKDSSSFRRLGSGFNGAAVHGEGIDVDVLISAGIEAADALAAVTSEDNVNIVVAQMAQQLFGVSRVVARIYDISREHVYRELGLETVCPTLLGVAQLHQRLTDNGYVQVRVFGSGELLEVDLSVPQHLSGKSVREVSIPSKLSIVVLDRAGQALLPDLETELLAGDRLTCVVRLDSLRAVRQIFGGEAKER